MTRGSLAQRLSDGASARSYAEWLAEMVSRPRRETWVAATLPVEPVDIARVLDLPGVEDAFAWRTAEGVEIGTAGAACVATAEGADRFGTIIRQTKPIFSSLKVLTFDGCRAVTPRFVGGFAFEERVDRRSVWAPFSAARFVLPRWTLFSDRGGVRLLYVARGRDGDQAYRDMLTLRSELDATPTMTSSPVIESVDRGDRAAWKEAVCNLTAAIHRGELEKVVVSRRLVAHATEPYRASFVFSRLVRQPSRAVHFAVRRQDATFVGASPERLIKKAGPMIETEALAGSRALDDPPVEALLDSAKDREEQAFVLRHIIERLSGRCRALHAPAEPALKRLRHVAHLCTPVQGELDLEGHVLDVAGALHPTPAVGGLPLQQAVARVAALEPDARGWYTGAVGWFDARGDGDLWVGLRSALLNGRAAQLYVGAGIVRDSKPDAELEETEVKARGLLSTLGAEV